MATNVVHPNVGFHHGPVNHSPSPFGFGFGLSNSTPSASFATSTSWNTPGHTQPAQFHQLASTMSQASSPMRPSKRRHEQDEETENIGRYGRSNSPRDDAMNRSPTPERPKKGPLKKLRVLSPSDSLARDEKAKGAKSPSGGESNDVDVGFLLASLPTESLLPLLNSLIKTQPALKSAIIPLIPRPSIETALRALFQAEKALRDAYPYSNAPNFSFTQSGPSTSTFGFGMNATRPGSSFGGTAFGRPANPSFGTQSSSVMGGNGMRDSYVLSRIGPHITKFVSACHSYLPYFSYLDTPSSASQSHSVAILAQQRGKSHPDEVFQFLQALTSHVLAQPVLAQTQLVPHLLPGLADEWRAWIMRVDAIVNQEGGMYREETVRTWEGALDRFADAKNADAAFVSPMREMRDLWVTKVGWLVGRTMQQPMEEEEL